MSGKRGTPGVLGLPGAQGPPGFKVSLPSPPPPHTHTIMQALSSTRIWNGTRVLLSTQGHLRWICLNCSLCCFWKGCLIGSAAGRAVFQITRENTHTPCTQTVIVQASPSDFFCPVHREQFIPRIQSEQLKKH